MPRVKQASKKRVIKTVPVLGAAGLTFLPGAHRQRSRRIRISRN